MFIKNDYDGDDDYNDDNNDDAVADKEQEQFKKTNGKIKKIEKSSKK